MAKQYFRPRSRPLIYSNGIWLNFKNKKKKKKLFWVVKDLKNIMEK